MQSALNVSICAYQNQPEHWSVKCISDWPTPVSFSHLASPWSRTEGWLAANTWNNTTQSYFKVNKISCPLLTLPVITKSVNAINIWKFQVKAFKLNCIALSETIMDIWLLSYTILRACLKEYILIFALVWPNFQISLVQVGDIHHICRQKMPRRPL